MSTVSTRVPLKLDRVHPSAVTQRNVTESVALACAGQTMLYQPGSAVPVGAGFGGGENVFVSGGGPFMGPQAPSLPGYSHP